MSSKLAGFVWSFVVGVAALALLAWLDGACTPAQRAAIPPAERAVCVMLRAADPSLAPYCATADDLAPFVPELLAEQADGGSSSSSARVAFSMPPPKKRAPRRHCTQWTAVDAGAEAAAP